MFEIFKEHVQSCVESLYSILFIERYDSLAFDDVIKQIAKECNAKCMEFRYAFGAVDFENKTSIKKVSLKEFLEYTVNEGYHKNVFLLLHDIDEELKDPIIISYLKIIAERNFSKDDYSATVFVLSQTARPPKQLENYSAILELPFPNEKEIHQLIKEFCEGVYTKIDESLNIKLTNSFKGLDSHQITQLLYLSYNSNGVISEDDIPMIVKAKSIIIQGTGLLELIPTNYGFSDVGGLGNMIEWVNKKKKIFDNLEAAQRFGVDIPKGMLIMGYSGCGKSLTAKATASEFNLPLLRLDVGLIMNKYLGESEHNFRHALHIAEAMSPCILWIDEIDKAFSGVGSEDNSSNVMTRLFGSFLYWMQEKESPVFVIATSNKPSLPAEFYRKGRFDEIFYVDLPNAEERADILKKILNKYRNTFSCTIDIDERILTESIAESCTKGFTGADIKAAVSYAIEDAYLGKQQKIDYKMIKSACERISPQNFIGQSFSDYQKITNNIKHARKDGE